MIKISENQGRMLTTLTTKTEKNAKEGSGGRGVIRDRSDDSLDLIGVTLEGSDTLPGGNVPQPCGFVT